MVLVFLLVGMPVYDLCDYWHADGLFRGDRSYKVRGLWQTLGKKDLYRWRKLLSLFLKDSGW